MVSACPSERTQHGYKQPLRSLPVDSNTEQQQQQQHYSLSLKTEPGYKYSTSGQYSVPEGGEEREDMIDNMMSYGLPAHGQTAASQDSLARISSMTNSISPPLNSHGSMSPGKTKYQISHTLTGAAISDIPFTNIKYSPRALLKWQFSIHQTTFKATFGESG